MSGFKEMLAFDAKHVFMNTDEFAEVHTVTTFKDEKRRLGQKDRELPMLIEKFTLDGRPIQDAHGVSVHHVVVHMLPEDLAYVPRVDQTFYLDFVAYTITGVSNDMGMLKIILQANGKRP